MKGIWVGSAFSAPSSRCAAARHQGITASHLRHTAGVTAVALEAQRRSHRRAWPILFGQSTDEEPDVPWAALDAALANALQPTLKGSLRCSRSPGAGDEGERADEWQAPRSGLAVRALVMELVDGETLAERIARGPGASGRSPAPGTADRRRGRRTDRVTSQE